MSAIILPYADSIFRCVEADPPWSMEADFGYRGYSGVPEFEVTPKYDRMPYHQIVNLGDEVRRVSTMTKEEPTHLWLWAQEKYVLEGMAAVCCRAWGFEPKRIYVWVYLNSKGEPTFKVGHWARTGHDCLIMATSHDHFRTLEATKTSTVFFGIKENVHSRKPPEAYDLIRRNSPGPRLSMFQRDRREGFICWGNELPDLKLTPVLL